MAKEVVPPEVEVQKVVFDKDPYFGLDIQQEVEGHQS